MTAEHAKLLLDENKSLEEKQQKFAALLVAHDEALTELLETLPKLRQQVVTEAMAGVVLEVEKRGADAVQAALPTLADSVRERLLAVVEERHSATAQRLDGIREELVDLAGKGVSEMQEANRRDREHVKEYLAQLTATSGEIERGLQARIEARLAEIAQKEAPTPDAAPAQAPFNLADHYKGQIEPGATLERGILYTWIGSTYLVLETTTETPNRSNVRGKAAKFALIAARGAAGAGGGEGGGSSLPPMVGQAGKVLSNDGLVAGWIALAGGGDMLAANNLSDVSSITASRNNLGLGTAATTNATSYATAAQGTKADSALQPTGDGSQLTGITAGQVGLGNVTNNAQTKASVVPNTVVTAGILVGQSGVAYASVTMSGDATIASTGIITFANTGVTASMFGSATSVPVITFDSKGRATGAVTVLITPDIANVTGLGTGISAALSVNKGSAGAPVLFNGDAGTPSVITLSNGKALPLTSGVTGVLPYANGGVGLTVAGVDPNIDTLIGWDDSAGNLVHFFLGSGLTSSGLTLSATGGGGSGQVVLPFIFPFGGGTAYTNMPTASSFLGGFAGAQYPLDLTNYTQARLVCHRSTAASITGAKLIARYHTAFTGTAATPSDLGTSEISVDINVTSTVVTSAWTNLAAGAKADVYVTIIASGGDGAADPNFGFTAIEVK